MYKGPSLEHVLCTLLEFVLCSFLDYEVRCLPLLGFPGGTSGKEPACRCRVLKRHEFNPWVGRIPSRSAWQPTPASLPGKFHGQRSLSGYSPWVPEELDTTYVTLHAHIHIALLHNVLAYSVCFGSFHFCRLKH